MKLKIIHNELSKEINYIFKNQSQRKILFDHLPKCGGSSINKFLEKNYLRRKTYNVKVENQDYYINRFINLSEKKRYGFDLIKGHLVHSLIDYVHPDTLKITLLRDPVERIISHYYYVKNNPGHYLYQAINKQNMGLEDYVSSGISNELRNWFVSHFLGISYEEAEQNPVKSIDAAVRLVLNNYNIIGFLNEIESFTDEVDKVAHLKYPYNGEQINKSERPKNNIIPENVIKTINNINFLDVEFYKQIREQSRKNYF